MDQRKLEETIRQAVAAASQPQDQVVAIVQEMTKQHALMADAMHRISSESGARLERAIAALQRVTERAMTERISIISPQAARLSATLDPARAAAVPSDPGIQVFPGHGVGSGASRGEEDVVRPLDHERIIADTRAYTVGGVNTAGFVPRG